MQTIKPYYILGLLGIPLDAVKNPLVAKIKDVIAEFDLQVGSEVEVVEGMLNFVPDGTRAAAALYFGGNPNDPADFSPLLSKGVPIIPVVSETGKFTQEVPHALRHLNAVPLGEGIPRIASALLENVGLLDRQRRLFISYRRDSGRDGAVQLFERFSAKGFEVFLDTHSVGPGADFQSVLWHRLCESDVVVMLDTPDYFQGRWTEEEFGRALAKRLQILRLGWPNHMPSRALDLTVSVPLTNADFEPGGTRFTDACMDSICQSAESLRSRSIAERHLAIVGDLKAAIERIGGQMEGVGLKRSVVLRLSSGRRVVAYPVIGVPTAESIYEADSHSELLNNADSALVYDHVGLSQSWHKQFGWLQKYVPHIRCIKVSEAAWNLAAWH